MFSGKEYQDANLGDGPLGLYDFGARFYDPAIARWLTQDPLRQFLSPYLYCANSPVNFFDPTGMFSLPQRDTSDHGFGGGTDMWGRDRFDSFSGLYIPYQDRPGGASVEGYGNSMYGSFVGSYSIKQQGVNYLKENFGRVETERGTSFSCVISHCLALTCHSFSEAPQYDTMQMKEDDCIVL